MPLVVHIEKNVDMIAARLPFLLVWKKHSTPFSSLYLPYEVPFTSMVSLPVSAEGASNEKSLPPSGPGF